MRIFFAVIAVLILGSVKLSAQTDLFFNINPKETLSYVLTDDNGDFFGKYDLTTAVAEGDMINGHVSMHHYFYDKSNNPLFEQDNNLMVLDLEIKDGKFFADLGSMKVGMKISDYMAKGDVSSLPSQLSVGQTIPDGHIELKMGIIKGNIVLSQRKVVAFEKVTTKAGTFDCYKITEKQVTKSAGISFVFTITTWYAKGIGCVKQYSYNKKGKKTTTELVSITRR